MPEYDISNDVDGNAMMVNLVLCKLYLSQWIS